MTPTNEEGQLKLALPKGRMQEAVFRLLEDAGVGVRATSRSYRPSVPFEGAQTKILKPQNIVEMLHVGARDMGFAGADWVAELEAEVVELLDTGFDPVRIVAAAPIELLVNGALPAAPLVAATEYARLTEGWIERRGLDARVLKTFGATEVFPPEDADVIVDNTATGATLEANRLAVVDELMRSTTRLYASRAAMDDPQKRTKIEGFVTLLRSVLDARGRVLLELNVAPESLAQVIEALPAMRSPTVSPLHGKAGYAVKAAVKREELARVVPLIKERGGSDIVVTRPAQIVP